MKKNKGVTLMSLTIYIAVIMIVLGILATVMANMQTNVKKAGKDGIQVAEINRFEMFFIQEVKKQGNAVEERTNNGTRIKFTSGNTYFFDDTNKEIKFQKGDEAEITIAEAINKCTFEDIEENGKTKIKVTIELIKMENQPIEKEYILNETQIAYDWEDEDDYTYQPIEETRLPEGFIELEYIESTGTQWIDTKIISSTEIQTNFDFEYTSINSSYNRIFGTAYTSGSQYGVRGSSNTNGYFYGELPNGSSKTIDTITLETGKKYQIRFNEDKKIIINNTESSLNGNNKIGVQNIFLFSHNGQNYPSMIKLYYCEMFDGNTRIREFIPCYTTKAVTNADGDTVPANTKGLYDIVEGKFYTNQNTNGNDFTAGPEVLPEVLPDEYQKVEYIESTGTQYIDTKTKGNSELHIVADLEILEQENIKGILGSREANTYANSIAFWVLNQKIRGDYGENINTYTYNNINYTGRHVFDINKGVYSVDNTSYTFSKETYSNNYNLALFTVNNSNTYDSRRVKARCYSLKIYNNMEEIQKYFVPCYRKVDNKPGLYDLVTNEFYTNQDNGTDFTLGL